MIPILEVQPNLFARGVKRKVEVGDGQEEPQQHRALSSRQRYSALVVSDRYDLFQGMLILWFAKYTTIDKRNSMYEGDVRSALTFSTMDIDYISVAVAQSPRRAQFWQSGINPRDCDPLRISGPGVLSASVQIRYIWSSGEQQTAGGR